MFCRQTTLRHVVTAIFMGPERQFVLEFSCYNTGRRDARSSKSAGGQRKFADIRWVVGNLVVH